MELPPAFTSIRFFYIRVNEAFSISLLSSVLGVNRMRLLVMPEASTSSSFV